MADFQRAGCWECSNQCSPCTGSTGSRKVVSGWSSRARLSLSRQRPSMYVMCVKMVMEQVCQQFQEIMEEEECDDETLCVLPQVRGGVLDCLQEELA